MKKRLLSLSLIALLFSCNIETAPDNNALLEKQTIKKKLLKNQSRFYWYNVFKLDNNLKEISGLSFANGYLYAHNDEDGDIFKLNPNNGNIKRKEKFGKNNDYEGIEVINNKAYIIKSNGKGVVYNLKNKSSKSFKTGLNSNNNVEGLCLNDNNHDELLVACKDDPLGFYDENIKGVYRYDLKDKKLKQTPYLLIDIDELKDFVKDEFFWNYKSYKKRIKKFSPSGITFHPTNGKLYIISAKGSSLVIFNNEKLEDIVFLDESDLPQPEGICFDNNNLYISSEGKNGSKATICKFSL